MTTSPRRRAWCSSPPGDPTTVLEIVALVQIVDQSGVGRLPVQDLAGLDCFRPSMLMVWPFQVTAPLPRWTSPDLHA
jgi:hypothetical protein